MAVRRRELWIGGALAGAFVVLRVVPFVGANTGRGVDSFDYLSSSHLPLLSRDFLGGARPFGYPLYLKLIAHNEHVAVVGQLLLDTAAWLWLALMAARATRRPGVRLAVAAVVLAIGLSFEAIQWDRIISSEALSTALGVALLAALLWLRERWTVPRLVVVAVLALGATAVRDTNGTLLGIVAVVLLIAVAARRMPRRVAALALVFVAASVMGSVSASSGRRWEGPLKDVITLRVLNSPERTAYFRDQGMPLTADEIAAARGHCVSPAPPSACVVIDDPAFYRWIRDHGRGTYAKSLLKFPATTVWEPVAHLRDSIGTRVQVELKFAADTEERAPVSKFLEAVVFLRNPLLVALAAVVVAIACVIGFVLRRRDILLVAVALLALTYPHLWLVWVGGALEVARHSILASVQLRLGIWLGLLWLLDTVLTPERPADAVELSDQEQP